MQAPDHVGHVAAEDAAVLVQLVDHHVAQVLEQLHPLGVVRQDAGVQHVRVGYDDVACRAHGPSRVGRRVAVVGERLDRAAETADQALQLIDLVLRQGLGWEEVEGARFRVLKHGVEDRQVVAHRLAGRGRRYDDAVAAVEDVADRFGLVRVEAVDAAAGQERPDPGVQPVREIGVSCGLRGELAPEAEIGSKVYFVS